MHTFQCVVCAQKWLPRSMPPDFKLSPPQGGKGVCEDCVGKLYEEPFEKKDRMWDSEDRIHRIETTVLSQPKSFSYVSYATTSEPSSSWWHPRRNVPNYPGRGEHCRRILQITIPCCSDGCENEEVVVHFTENTVRRWGGRPLWVWFERGSLWYESAYYECCGIEHLPDNGDDVEEWADRFCEAEDHECESCKDWFENKIYTYAHADRQIKKAYLAMKANPSPENREEYEGLAMYRRQQRSTQEPQIAATTSILDAFFGEDPTGCVRSGLTVGPPHDGYGSSDGRCGLQLKSRDIEIPLPDSMSGEFIGNGYLCEEHDQGE